MKKLGQLLLTCGVAVGICEMADYDLFAVIVADTFAILVGVAILIKH